MVITNDAGSGCEYIQWSVESPNCVGAAINRMKTSAEGGVKPHYGRY